MKIGVEYLRYSSERQTEQSIEGQMRVCDEYAERNGIVIVERYIDRAMTGKNDQRDAFQRMLKASANKAWDCVLVYKTDRFGRNKYELAINKHTLKTNGIKLVSVTENIPDTPEGIILESVLEGMAEYYSAELSQKILRGLRESRIKGQFTGGNILYGYEVKDKKVYINEEEAEIVRYIYNQYLSDVSNIKIADDLNGKGLTLRGHKFAPSTIYELLRNEKFTGVVRIRGEVYDNIYPPIISRDLFELMRKKLAENHSGRRGEKAVRFLLKNKVYCGICGERITSDAGTARDGSVKRYYKCIGREKHRCAQPTIRKDDLENIVIETTYKVLSDSQVLTKIADRILVSLNSEKKRDLTATALKNELAKARTSLNNLLAALEQGIFTNGTKARMEELENKIETIEQNLLAERAKEKIKLSKTEVIRFIKNALLKEPKQAIYLLVNKIILYPEKVEIFYNYTEKPEPDDEDHRAFSFYKGEICHENTALKTVILYV